MGKGDDFNIHQLKSRVDGEHKRLTVTLMSELKNLKVRTEQAIKALGERKGLDAHLIVNAGSITEGIARWNMTLDLLPYLEGEGK